jgi:hypothetical protein
MLKRIGSCVLSVVLLLTIFIPVEVKADVATEVNLISLLKAEMLKKSFINESLVLIKTSILLSDNKRITISPGAE